ncbi:uncharacterized protein PgNI_07620 [Pyricularia grisea]|uniref:Uncharacterized protein n=1 Tax=Pyricularia grisea TaxID=148305 RepID=A0A6P8B1E0_PYRGI|nr:uncharacterized protein PgNI_07620 [Pyricularia grisea]TLD08710.1 hypothetical protein PgNI_07620 [Pyricularia grisea]
MCGITADVFVGCTVDKIVASRHLLGFPPNATRTQVWIPPHVACMFMNMTMRLADINLAHWHRQQNMSAGRLTVKIGGHHNGEPPS